MKERVVLFSDAIIAIILTIMVLELPIQYGDSGAVDLGSLFSAVGIYFISFCFVANVWFQTAYGFNRIEQVKNKILVIYLLLLFFLSLVPSATRLLIDDTNEQTLLIYGILTLVVTVITRRLIVALTKQAITDKTHQKRRVDELNRQDMLSFAFRIALLVVAHFLIKPALVIYLILPILAFLQNIADREEDIFVDSLDHEEQTQYFKDRNHLWGNSMRRYSSLLRDSLNGDEAKSDAWKKIMNEWRVQVDKEIAIRQAALSSVDASDKEKLLHEIDVLNKQKKRMSMQHERMEHKQQKKQQQND